MPYAVKYLGSNTACAFFVDGLVLSSVFIALILHDDIFISIDKLTHQASKLSPSYQSNDIII